MQLEAFLCNHAEAVNNLLYISGGGTNFGVVSPGSSPPYRVTLGIGLMVTVPWQSTNQKHDLEITLLTEDGDQVQFQGIDGLQSPVNLRLAFNVGRPPNVPPGDDQHVCLAANFPSLPLPALAKYEFLITIDGSGERKLPYRLTPTPGPQLTYGQRPPGGA